MKSKKLVLCILIAIAFSLSLGTNLVYADETLAVVGAEISNLTDANDESNMNEELHSDSEHEDSSYNEDNMDDSIIDDEELVEDTTLDIDEIEEDEAEAEDETEIEETSSEKNEETSSDKNEETSSDKNEEVAKEKVAPKKKEKNYTKSELRLLASLIYAEAGNQSYKGKVAVANVVLNRVKSSIFSHTDTVKEVIYDKKWGVQFSVIKVGSKTNTSPLGRALNIYDSKSEYSEAIQDNMNACIKAAKAAFDGEDVIGNYLYFNRYSKSLATKYKNHTILGDHIFYNTK